MVACKCAILAGHWFVALNNDTLRMFLFSEKAIKTMIWQYTAKYLIALLEFIGFPKVIIKVDDFTR